MFMRQSSIATAFAMSVAVAALGVSLSAGPAWANPTWGNPGERCSGTTRVLYSRLHDIPWGQDWTAACNRTRMNGALPNKCIDKGAGGMWGEWYQRNHASCQPAGPKWGTLEQSGCTSPNKQVVSARLWDIKPGQDWETVCRRTAGPGGRGVPDRCAKDALSTGIWGEWYENRACSKPLQWGSFKNNGCVARMKNADSNVAGIDLSSKRSYSAVLYNVGGDWKEACRLARATVAGSGFEHPTACIVADANQALSWVTTGVFSALGAAATTGLTGGNAIAGAVVAGGIAKGLEGVIFDNADTGLNVWGVFWKDDPSCGPVPTYSSADYATLPDGRGVLKTGEVLPQSRIALPVQRTPNPVGTFPRRPEDTLPKVFMKTMQFGASTLQHSRIPNAVKPGYARVCLQNMTATPKSLQYSLRGINPLRPAPNGGQSCATMPANFRLEFTYNDNGRVVKKSGMNMSYYDGQVVHFRWDR